MIGEGERLDGISWSSDHYKLGNEVDHSSFVGDVDLPSIKESEKEMKRDD